MAIIEICNIFAEKFSDMDKIIGIGNVLVDVMVRLDDDRLLDEFCLPKGSMQLIDDEKYRRISRKFATMRTYMATGGSACNVMLALANLGVPVGIVGKIGRDELGAFFRRNSIEHGIDIRLEESDLPSGVASTFISPDGQRTFGTYLGAAGAMSADDLHADSFRGFSYLYIEGYLVQDHALVVRACELARAAGMKICYDLASYNIVEADRDFITHILDEYVDIVFANEDEARAFAGEGDALADLARRCEVAVVKVGSRGAYIRRGEEQVHVPAMDVPRVVDTNAAGDFFAAGFLYGYMRRCPLEACGRIGSQLSGHVIQIVGTALPREAWNEIKLNIRTIWPE